MIHRCRRIPCQVSEADEGTARRNEGHAHVRLKIDFDPFLMPKGPSVRRTVASSPTGSGHPSIFCCRRSAARLGKGAEKEEGRQGQTNNIGSVRVPKVPKNVERR